MPIQCDKCMCNMLWEVKYNKETFCLERSGKDSLKKSHINGVVKGEQEFLGREGDMFQTEI